MDMFAFPIAMAVLAWAIQRRALPPAPRKHCLELTRDPAAQPAAAGGAAAGHAALLAAHHGAGAPRHAQAGARGVRTPRHCLSLRMKVASFAPSIFMSLVISMSIE